MPHVVLLGDSIFDNRAYVRPGEPDVVTQLRSILGSQWQTTLRAVDGSVTADVSRQLADVPVDATHFVLSTGGNDALGHIDILESPARSAAGVLGRLADAAQTLAGDYVRLLAQLETRALPFVLCTIYEGNFDDPLLQRLASTALTVFNDVIIRQAVRARAPLIDLRRVCRAPEDYANPIEPSATGGEKIARAIARVLVEHDFYTHGTRIYS